MYNTNIMNYLVQALALLYNAMFRGVFAFFSQFREYMIRPFFVGVAH